MYTQQNFFDDCVSLTEDLEKLYENNENLTDEIKNKIEDEMLPKLEELKKKMFNCSISDYSEKSSMYFCIILENVKAFISSKSREIECINLISSEDLTDSVVKEKYEWEIKVSNEFAKQHLSMIYQFSKIVVDEFVINVEAEPVKKRKWYNIFKK